MINEQVKSGLQIDGAPEELEAVKSLVKNLIDQTSPDADERTGVYKKRRDFFEGRHHLYSNVVGLGNKEKQGHILAVFNYVWRMSTRLVQALSNLPFRYKIRPSDEASEIESIRAEAEENWYMKILRDNQFFNYLFRRNCTIQVRDADFAIKVIVENDEEEGKRIKIYHAENMEKLHVVWDDSSGRDYSAVFYRDKWTLEKIAREFNGYMADAAPDDSKNSGGGSQGDEFGIHAGTSTGTAVATPTGNNKVPKAWVTDGWGWFKVIDEMGVKSYKMCNVTMINDDVVQFVHSDYKKNPWIIGHSFDNPGKPWSISFEDNLIDSQIELNDRTSEEGDMIRIGANQKYVVVNMPNFDATSVKPGSGQVIYIQGERADFKPLDINVNPFPTETYIQRTLKHMFALGIPEIALATGSAPYTGRVGAIQYQPISDLVDELRMKWTPVLEELFDRLHSYTVQFFPETKPFMQAYDDDSQQSYDVKRQIDFEWDSILPQSQSEDVVNASTLFDRGVLPIKRYLEKSGYQDPMSVIKELKRESKDKELSTVRQQFKQLSSGVVEASIDARRAQMEAEEQAGSVAGQIADATKPQPTQPAAKPIMQKWQNSDTGAKGIPAGAGVEGVGQTASQTGFLKQASQNLRAGGQ